MIEVLTGIVSGTVSGTGMGGGTILILVLSLFLGVEQHTAQATNLVFFVPTSIVAIITCCKQKLINFKLGMVIALFGVVGAIAGAMLTRIVDANMLKKLFGIFLGIVAIYEIYSLRKKYISKEKRHNN